MRKQHLFIAMLFITAAITLVGCNKKEEVDQVTVYGTVVDAESGLPVQNVQITVDKEYMSEEQQREDMGNGTAGTVGSTITGSDGTYEFPINNIDRKYTYIIYTLKTGYQQSETYISFSNVQSGGKLKCDFRLKPGNDK